MGFAPQWSIHSTLLLCLQRMVGLCECHIRSAGDSDDNNDEDPYRDAAALFFRSLGWDDYQAAILAFLNFKSRMQLQFQFICWRRKTRLRCLH